MKIAARGVTDVGQKRDHNEDSFLVDEALGLFVVADGMGGHAGGGTASLLAVQMIEATLHEARRTRPEIFGGSSDLATGPIREVLGEAVDRACAAIHAAARQDVALAGMGTTVTAAVVDGSRAFLAHVGDSRCYLVRGDRIHQLSEDHSLVNEQLKAGAITPDEARTSRFKNIITRSVGFERDVQVDLLGVELRPGDHLVICCDGLSNLVADDEIRRVVVGSSLDDAPRQLVALANERGGDDNITVIVVRCE